MTIYLTSPGYKILSILFSVAIFSLTLVLVIFAPQHYFFCVFSALGTIFCWYSVFICFNHRIKADKNGEKIKVYAIKTKTIGMDNLQRIVINVDYSLDKSKYCFIDFILKDGQIVRTAGCSILVNRHQAVKITTEKVNDLIIYLNEKGYNI